MFILDAHLDLAMNALEWNRDLTWTVEDIRKSKKIKTLKDFAELSMDELMGGYDEKKGVKFKIDGYLEEFALTNNEAENLIINARNIVFK